MRLYTENFYKKMFFLLGLFSTMNAVALPVGSGAIAVYNFILLLLLVVTVVNNYCCRKPIIYLNKSYYCIYAFYLSLIISSVIACFTISDLWYYNSVIVTIKFLILTGGLVLLFPLNFLRKYTYVFLKGIYISSYVHLTWAIFQMFFWYVLGTNLNVLVFEETLKIGVGEIDWNANIMGGIVCRMSGLSWEPANFALVMIVGYILATKKWEKLIFMIATLSSTSRTGMLALGMLIIAQLFILGRKKTFSIKFTIKGLFKVFIVASIVLSIILKFEDTLIILISNIERTIDAIIIGITTMDNESANIHKLYYLELANMMVESTWYNILFGFGTFSAGYPYQISGIVSHGASVWNPESDMVTILVGNGLLGAILYYYIIVKNIIIAKNKLSIYITFSIAVAGITYLFIRGTWTFILLIFLINYKIIKNKDLAKN